MIKYNKTTTPFKGGGDYLPGCGPRAKKEEAFLAIFFIAWIAFVALFILNI